MLLALADTGNINRFTYKNSGNINNHCYLYNFKQKTPKYKKSLYL